MVRKILFILFLLLIVTCGNSFGTFIANGDYVIDNSSGFVWYSDLEDFWNMTYDQQVAAVDSLNSGSGTFGFKNWRLATTFEVTQMFTQWKNTYTSSSWDYFNYTFSYFDGPYEEYFWDGRTADHDAALIKYVANGSGNYSFGEPITIRPVSDEISTNQVSAWVMTKTPVPEPATLIFFGAGIISLFGLLRKHQ